MPNDAAPAPQVRNPAQLLELFKAELTRDDDLAGILAMVEPYQHLLAGDEERMVGWLHKLVGAFHRAEAAAGASS